MTAHEVARALPGVEELRSHCRGLAMLDAALSPEWDSRFHSFSTRWEGGGQLATRVDGVGGEYSIVFVPAGVYIRGFDHESLMSPWARMDEPVVWPGVLEDVPEIFGRYVHEPVFCSEEGVPLITCCLWRRLGDPAWRTGAIDYPREGDGDPDGANVLFELVVDRSAEAYARWASDYYGRAVDVDAVRSVLALRPLTPELVAVLNPELGPADLATDIAAIGYPT